MRGGVHPFRLVTLLLVLFTACSVETFIGPTDRDASIPVDAPLVDAPNADGPAPDAPVPDGALCVDGMRRCEASVADECIGGLWVSTPCDLECAPDGLGCGTLVPSNVGALRPDSTCPAVSVASNVSHDTGACASLPLGRPSVVMQSDGSQLCVVCASTFSVAAGSTLSITGPLPIAFLVSGDVTIDGVIDVAGALRVRGAGGANGGSEARLDGFGPNAGRGGTNGGSEDGGGGGGGSCGRGGVGGDGSSARGGAGGAATSPTWMLAPLLGGSGGGAGPGGGAGATTNVGSGGGGGGALQISTPGMVTLVGRIDAGGGGGGAGDDDAGAGDPGAGGGGGGGGSVLIEARELVFVPGGRILATGGGGGGSGGGTNGQDGRTIVDRAEGGSAGPTGGAAGGRSGGSSTNAGRNGGTIMSGGGNGGGGGGGVGCVLIRTVAGGLPTGALDGSPRLQPALRTASLVLE